MAISEDTAALVAAQLTVAWATRVGVITKPDTARPADGRVLAIYERIRAVVREVDIKSSAFDTM